MHEIDAEQPVWKSLAQVADDDLQAREAVEHAAHDDAQDVEAGFDGESEDRAIKAALQKGTDHGGRWRIRMDVNRNIERFGGFEYRPELRIVEVLAAGVGVDDGAFQSERPDAAFEFLCSGCGVLRGDGGEAGEAVRMTCGSHPP